MRLNKDAKNRPIKIGDPVKCKLYSSRYAGTYNGEWYLGKIIDFIGNKTVIVKLIENNTSNDTFIVQLNSAYILRWEIEDQI